MTCGRHEMEALTEDGAFSVDILLRREGIAVEVTRLLPAKRSYIRRQQGAACITRTAACCADQPHAKGDQWLDQDGPMLHRLECLH